MAPFCAMTEQSENYVVTIKGGIVQELESCGCLRRYDDAYVRPSPEQIKRLRNHLGLSQAEFASIVGVTYRTDKGSTTVRKWETNENKVEHRHIPYSAWRLLLIDQKIISIDN